MFKKIKPYMQDIFGLALCFGCVAVLATHHFIAGVTLGLVCGTFALLCMLVCILLAPGVPYVKE